jgi:hypothetical protein
MTIRELVKAYNRKLSADMAAIAEHRAEAQRERFQKVSKRWLSRWRVDNGVPDGYRVLPATVYTDGTHIVVCAEPSRLFGDDEESHNCDAMGCRWEHVVLRGCARD